LLAITIGDGVAAFVQLDAAQSRQVAVFDIDQTRRDSSAQQAFDGLGHPRTCFPGAEDVDVRERIQPVSLMAGTEILIANFYMAKHSLGWISSFERGLENPESLLAQ
jgi:outer membrane protein assembly factor BamD (BamD/ComL family)